MAGDGSLPPLDLTRLRAAYAAGTLDPPALVEALLPALAASDPDALWITRTGEVALRARAASLLAIARDARGPLWGIPIAVKDNIDVAGLPTTAGCPGFAYLPERSATSVARLEAAGAIIVGKTNLDQFATGLVGVRSPHGTAVNPFGAGLIPGGSSSGSAVAVARGLVSAALGTDTAGSGRVPAGFTNVIGLKPTRGRVPTTGVVPACRSLDCVSVFALTASDALGVMEVMTGPDGLDAFARSGAEAGPARPCGQLRLGAPRAADLTWSDDQGYEAAWDRALPMAAAALGAVQPVDTGPLQEAAALLYAGPWVAERLAALESFIDRRPEEVWPVTREIILGGRRWSAVDVFNAGYRLEALRRAAEALFTDIDVLVVPTAPTLPTRAAVAAEPLLVNARLGTWTNFVNLLDLAAIAVPAATTENGRPFGLTLIAPAFHDRALATCAQALQRASGLSLGATGRALCVDERPIPPATDHPIELFVVGAHLRGEPLHGQLQAAGARLVAEVETASHYRLVALVGPEPPRPALVRVAPAEGAAIAGELYALPARGFARFVAALPAPMAIAKVTLADGRVVPGFACEAAALEGARDITAWGGWRAYRASLRAATG